MSKLSTSYSMWKIILNFWCFSVFIYKNALHHITVVDWLLPQMCIISFHRDCKALQDLLDPGDCQEKLYVLCHFSSCSCGARTVRQWSSATQVTLAAPFVGGTAAIRCWSTVGQGPSTGHRLEFQEAIYILFDSLEWIWILGSLKWDLFTLDYLSLVPFLAFCSLDSHSSWETIAWLGWLSNKLSWFVLCSCWQLPSTDVTGQGFAEMQCACGCKTAVLGVSSSGTSQQSWNVPVFIAFLGVPHSGLPADWAGWWGSPSWGF